MPDPEFSELEPGSRWDAFLIANGDFFFDFYLTMMNCEETYLIHQNGTGKSLEVDNVKFFPAGSSFQVTSRSESGDGSWFFLNRILKFLIPVCAGGKEESSIEEQVDFTELDSGVRGETEDSSQSIDLDIRYRYCRYRLDI